MVLGWLNFLLFLSLIGSIPQIQSFKKKKFKYLCIYFLLHWVFVVRVAFLWLQSGDSSRVVLRLLIAVASLVEHEL